MFLGRGNICRLIVGIGRGGYNKGKLRPEYYGENATGLLSAVPATGLLPSRDINLVPARVLGKTPLDFSGRISGQPSKMYGVVQDLRNFIIIGHFITHNPAVSFVHLQENDRPAPSQVS